MEQWFSISGQSFFKETDENNAEVEFEFVDFLFCFFEGRGLGLLFFKNKFSYDICGIVLFCLIFWFGFYFWNFELDGLLCLEFENH